MKTKSHSQETKLGRKSNHLLVETNSSPDISKEQDFEIYCNNCNSTWSIMMDLVPDSFLGLRADLVECPLCWRKEDEE